MHYLAIAFVLLSYPALVHLLQTQLSRRHWAYFFLGMLPFVVHTWQVEAALINWAAWPGYAKGMVLTLEDTLALAVITTHRQPRGRPPLTVFIALYMTAVAQSIVQAEVPMASAFYLFQLMRFIVVVIAIAKIAGNPHALRWLGMGLACGMTYEAVITINQKFHGVFQAAGNMAHPNQLGMMAHFVILPLLGMLLAGYRSRILMLGIVSSLVVVIAGASRATIGLVGLGVGLVLLLSLLRHHTRQKKRMVGFAATAMLVATPFLLNSVGKRLAQQQEHQSDYDERAAFERSAEAIWRDYPMGVGANYYIPIANGKGYAARAGVTWAAGSRATNVHNTFLLVAAETGWPGLITYMAMIGAAFLAGWKYAFGRRRDPSGDIALGATIAIAMMALHSKYEWITMTYHVQYVIAISFGIIAGLVRMRAFERRQAQNGRIKEQYTAHTPTGELVA